MSIDKKVVRAWRIGPEDTEVYAAYTEDEVRQMYIEMVGKEKAEKDFAKGFNEIPPEEMDTPMDFNDEENGIIRTTWREVAESALLPTQIGTDYV